MRSPIAICSTALSITLLFSGCGNGDSAQTNPSESQAPATYKNIAREFAALDRISGESLPSAAPYESKLRSLAKLCELDLPALRTMILENHDYAEKKFQGGSSMLTLLESAEETIPGFLEVDDQKSTPGETCRGVFDFLVHIG